jgi:RIO kinase 1
MSRFDYRAFDETESDEPLPPPKPRKRMEHIHLTDDEASPNAFVMTYQPTKFESTWLKQSLQYFFLEHYISDVLASVKGGKEASVYRCAPPSELDDGWLAAKVYRPRMFRNLRNDSMYRDGRPVLTSDGKAVKKTDHRLIRALNKKTEFGAQVQHTSWLMYEFTTLGKLYAAGADVPQPIAVAENAILMRYIGDANRAAPTLHETTIPISDASRLFDRVIYNIDLMMQQGFVHGDLSAYNILYWQGEITLIDFPQVMDIEGNHAARSVLQRDITRVCDYFARYGIKSNPAMLTDEIWQRYLFTEEVSLDELLS